MTILMVDDDIELCALLKNFFLKEGIISDCLYSGKDALNLFLSSEPPRYDLVILETTMPGSSGLELLQAIRARSIDIPVIILTGRGDPMDKVGALKSGADDYVCKPCDPRELAARIHAILRRTGSDKLPLEYHMRLFDIELNRFSRTVRINSDIVDLTDTEFQMLDILLKNAGNVVPLESLSTEILGRSYVQSDRSLNTHASRLRQKLGPHPDGSSRIRAPRGKGFMYIYPSVPFYEQVSA